MPAAHNITELLGSAADNLLSYQARGFNRDALHLPGPDFVDRVMSITDRPAPVLRNFQALLDHGRLAGTGQANHLGVTIQADIIKQKLPVNNGGYNALKFGKTDPRVYTDLTPDDHPIDLCRYQVANCYLGRSPLINSGGASGRDDFADAARMAVINKRAGGMGLISGRNAFQRPMAEGGQLLNLIQDVYLDQSITVA